MASKQWYQKNKEAVKEKARKYYYENRDKTLENVKEYRDKNREEIRKKGRDYYRRKLKNRMLNSARARSRTHGYEFDLCEEDFIIPEYCPLLGIKMVVNEKGTTKMDSFSLDRIDSSKGYVKGNVWVISMLANSMKSGATYEQFQTMAKNWSMWKEKNYDLSQVPQRKSEYYDEE